MSDHMEEIKAVPAKATLDSRAPSGPRMARGGISDPT